MTANLNDPRIPETFWAQITVTEGGCWKWCGSKMHGLGYSRLSLGGGVRVLGHRHFYTVLVGEIPPGLVIDHTCHNADLSCNAKGECPHRACVNPAHLEPVTSGENVTRSTKTASGNNAAKAVCKNGHRFDEANTRVYATSSGVGRGCRKCATEWGARKAAEDREAHLQRGRDYYAANRERMLADKRAYDATRKAEKSANQKALRARKKAALSSPVED